MSYSDDSVDDSDSSNVCCHYCRVSKNRKRKRIIPYVSCSSCPNVYCYNCVSTYLGLDFEEVKENRIWRCNICRDSCCCCHGDCQIRHRHCFTYTRTKRRYEKAKRLDIQQQQLQQQRTTAGLAGPTESQSATAIENYSRVPKKPATPVDKVQVSSAALRPDVSPSGSFHASMSAFGAPSVYESFISVFNWNMEKRGQSSEDKDESCPPTKRRKRSVVPNPSDSSSTTEPRSPTSQRQLLPMSNSGFPPERHDPPQQQQVYLFSTPIPTLIHQTPVQHPHSNHLGSLAEPDIVGPVRLPPAQSLEATLNMGHTSHSLNLFGGQNYTPRQAQNEAQAQAAQAQARAHASAVLEAQAKAHAQAQALAQAQAQAQIQALAQARAEAQAQAEQPARNHAAEQARAIIAQTQAQTQTQAQALADARTQALAYQQLYAQQCAQIYAQHYAARHQPLFSNASQHARSPSELALASASIPRPNMPSGFRTPREQGFIQFEERPSGLGPAAAAIGHGAAVLGAVPQGRPHSFSTQPFHKPPPTINAASAGVLPVPRSGNFLAAASQSQDITVSTSSHLSLSGSASLSQSAAAAHDLLSPRDSSPPHAVHGLWTDRKI